MNSEKQFTNLQMILREVNRVGEGQKNVPKLRFKGFTDAWEQGKVSNYASFLTGNGLSWSDITKNGKKECILYGNLYTDFGMITDRAVCRTNSEIKNPVYSEFGDVLIPASDTTPSGLARATSIEKSGVLIGGDINIIRPNKEINGSCLSLSLNVHKRELIRLIKGTTVRHIHNSDIKNILISLPSEEKEQLKITSYFKLIDYSLTLHQRKYDALKAMKKTLLSKMFPKDGKDVPEIRFKEFTDAWEQRKLGNVAKYRNGKAHEQSVSENGKYIIVNSKFVSTNGEVRKFSCEQIEPLFKNEIAFVLSDVPNGRAIARTFLIPHDDKYTLNQRIAGITPNETTDCYFLHLLMNRNRYFLRFDDGVKQTNLSVNDVMQFSTYYPLYEEQQLCGQFYQKIDNLITLHQRKLEELKNMKKTLLQQMFV